MLFVYGTLRRGAFRGNQPNTHATRLEAEAIWLGTARVRGRLYQVNPEYPGLVEPQNEGEWVSGEVWQFDNDDLWAALDFYEGDEYVRVPWAVVMADGKERFAWVYRYASKITTAMAMVGV